MTINTSKFGLIDIDDEKTLFFDNGILGFEHLKKYAIINTEDTKPFYWLQSLEDKDIALPCMNPFDIIPTYSPEVNENVLDGLEVKKIEDILIITTVSVPIDPSKSTTNLAAPIIINTSNNKGIQCVLQNAEYDVRQSVFHTKEDAHNVDIIKEAK